jgi:hypothetical protein
VTIHKCLKPSTPRSLHWNYAKITHRIATTLLPAKSINSTINFVTWIQ